MILLGHFLDNTFTIISGPCSFEGQDQIREHLDCLETSKYLRAGIFKLRTNKDSFQGLRARGIEQMSALKVDHNFCLVSEVVSMQSLEALKDVVDIIQVGTRNMYNYELLKELSKQSKPVILKRGLSATIDEWVQAAQYINSDENQVILCERGIRSFESKYRNTLDLNAVSYLKQKTNYKVLVDPSHGTGNTFMIEDLSKASMAIGADGILVEAHFNPAQALSDAHQALTLPQLRGLIQNLNSLAPHFNKKVVF